MIANGPEIVVCENGKSVAAAGADLFGRAAQESVSRHGAFSVALSGGSTPRAMHSLFARPPHLSEVPWERTHVFWVDDRCLPPEHAESNYGRAQIDFLASVPLKADQVHAMPVTDPPQKGAAAYQRELEAFFRVRPGQIPVFDLVFLGIGADGHTASLFPGDSMEPSDRRWVIAVKGGNPYVFRLSLNYPVINAARRVVFQVTGNKKAAIVKTVLEGNDPRLPASRIHPRKGILTWLLDRGAVSRLSPSLFK